MIYQGKRAADLLQTIIKLQSVAYLISQKYMQGRKAEF